MGTTPTIRTTDDGCIKDTLGIVFLYLGAPLYFATVMGLFGVLLGLPLAWYLTRFRAARRMAFWLNAILLLLMLPGAFLVTMI